MEAQAKRIAELADLLVESGERLKKQSERIAELERDKEALKYALDTYAAAVDLKDKRIDELYERIAESKAELKETVVEQYYYRVSGCKAKRFTDPDCICWHDKGTGPLADCDEELTLAWRTKPNFDKQRVAELEKCITERKILKRLLADAVRFIAYAQSKGVHGGEAIAKEIEENLNHKKP